MPTAQFCLAIIVFVVFTVFADWGDSDLDTTAGTQKVGEVKSFEDWDKFDGAVVLALTPSCPYRVQSMPF
ncbi:MAG: hypothetical protein F4246_05315 [Rhodothermaceae bacterium]|nr:hypothetical protein [Rhodothermaceae bacterium]MYD20125.1 hypothetical protein [Rhodothermaceae bacterium]MYD56415.1 hypothetical protein [Rhodothermaceae bacterium]MYI44137.1 hypothetical protein [Rhodothermaceae bacterium]MYJ55076.1 hypothetical protein [Rhodothermaceae bacterium]